MLLTKNTEELKKHIGEVIGVRVSGLDFKINTSLCKVQRYWVHCEIKTVYKGCSGSPVKKPYEFLHRESYESPN